MGNDKIGGTKLEEMSKYDAISDFKRLFLEKTGNSWEAWEQKQNFQKQPGRFFPLDIVLLMLLLLLLFFPLKNILLLLFNNLIKFWNL